jgi:serine kinase of HPr protein (carbohydrate metabolism regulator)
LSTAPSVADDVVELRAAYAAQPPGTVDTTLQSLAEVVGFLIHQMRTIGADQDELLHNVEVLIRAANQNREDIRRARDTLQRLGYGDALAKLLTRLARKAKPAPPTFAERMRLKAIKPSSRQGTPRRTSA